MLSVPLLTVEKCADYPYTDILLHWTHTGNDASDIGHDPPPMQLKPNIHVIKAGKHIILAVFSLGTM